MDDKDYDELMDDYEKQAEYDLKKTLNRDKETFKSEMHLNKISVENR